MQQEIIEPIQANIWWVIPGKLAANPNVELREAQTIFLQELAKQFLS